MIKLHLRNSYVCTYIKDIDDDNQSYKWNELSSHPLAAKMSFCSLKN